jgi:hypothetical protein
MKDNEQNQLPPPPYHAVVEMRLCVSCDRWTRYQWCPRCGKYARHAGASGPFSHACSSVDSPTRGTLFEVQPG